MWQSRTTSNKNFGVVLGQRLCVCSFCSRRIFSFKLFRSNIELIKKQVKDSKKVKENCWLAAAEAAGWMPEAQTCQVIIGVNYILSVWLFLAVPFGIKQNNEKWSLVV